MIGPRLKKLLEELDLQTDLWWLALMAIGLLGSVLGAFAFKEWGLFWAYLTLATRLCIVVHLGRQEWGRVFKKLLPLGLAFGVFSIFPDYLLIHVPRKGYLHFPPEAGVLLLASPAYVILGWALRIVEFGYLVTRVYGIFIKRWPGETGLGVSMVVGGASSAILVGSREYLGAHAGWWGYGRAGAFIGGASPVYTLAAAALFFGFFLLRFPKYVEDESQGLMKEVRHGALLSGILIACYGVSYFLIEGPNG